MADLLVSLGMQEGTRNIHEGQGTSNRRFFFANCALELLWVHDSVEANNGPGRDMLLSKRSVESTASPFGIILQRTDNSIIEIPFNGWNYQPDYFSPPRAFHIGENSNKLVEPLCIYAPFIEPDNSTQTPDEGIFKFISSIRVYTPSDPLSDVLLIANSADRLSIEQGPQHLIEITFDDHKSKCSKDLRPDIPLIIYW